MLQLHRATHQGTAEKRPVLYHRVRNLLRKSNSLQWTFKTSSLNRISLLLGCLLPLSTWVIELQIYVNILAIYC
jgi:hypothetical protein